MKDESNLLGDARKYAAAAFEAHPEFFDRMREFNSLMRALDVAFLELMVSVGIAGLSDHSIRRDEARSPVEQIDRVQKYFLARFYEYVPEEERSVAYAAARERLEELLNQAKNVLVLPEADAP